MVYGFPSRPSNPPNTYLAIFDFSCTDSELDFGVYNARFIEAVDLEEADFFANEFARFAGIISNGLESWTVFSIVLLGKTENMPIPLVAEHRAALTICENEVREYVLQLQDARWAESRKQSI